MNRSFSGSKWENSYPRQISITAFYIVKNLVCNARGSRGESTLREIWSPAPSLVISLCTEVATDVVWLKAQSWTDILAEVLL